MSGGVGGGGREADPYPDFWWTVRPFFLAFNQHRKCPASVGFFVLCCRYRPHFRRKRAINLEARRRTVGASLSDNMLPLLRRGSSFAWPAFCVSATRGTSMRPLIAIRAALVAFALIVGLATAAYADVGSIRFNVLKAGFVIGGSAGSGAMNFQGRIYPLIIAGVSYGFTFGGSLTDFVGTVTNIRAPSDVNGIYVAGGAGAAVGVGGGAIVLANQNGAVLTLSGFQSDLSLPPTSTGW
jgi:hypothetical protein